MVRAVAALLVALFHAETLFSLDGRSPFLRGIFSAGYRGVDLFFVLSGFVIFYAHAKDLGHVDRLPNYIFNRISRIFPALWIMSLLALGVYAAGFSAGDNVDKLSSYPIVASFLLLPQQRPPLVNVSWTLTFELFFYGLFAVMLINQRAGLLLLLGWQAAVAVVALAGLEPGMDGYYLRATCLEFGVGLACAGWVQRNGAVDRPTLWWAVLAAGVASFLGGMAADEASRWAGAFCAVGAGAIVMALVQLEMTGRMRIPAVLVAIGGASYSIYLVHFSVLNIGSKLAGRLGLPASDWVGLGFVAAGVLAGFGFDRLIDRPIQRWLRALKPRVVGPARPGSQAISERPG